MNASKVCQNSIACYQNALKMNEQVQEKNGIDIMTLDGNERLKLAVKELSIGSRIREELRIQGRTVSWLARQLCMERTSLYYTFRQNSIDMELLMRISFILNHNFMLDVAGVYSAYRP